jgi:hypothetical protein
MPEEEIVGRSGRGWVSLLGERLSRRQNNEGVVEIA